MTEMQKIKKEVAEKDNDIRLLETRINKLEDENQALAHDRYMAETHYEKERKKVERLEQEIQEWKHTAFNLMAVVTRLKTDLHFKDIEIAKHEKADMPF